MATKIRLRLHAKMNIIIALLWEEALKFIYYDASMSSASELMPITILPE